MVAFDSLGSCATARHPNCLDCALLIVATVHDARRDNYNRVYQRRPNEPAPCARKTRFTRTALKFAASLPRIEQRTRACLAR